MSRPPVTSPVTVGRGRADGAPPVTRVDSARRYGTPPPGARNDIPHLSQALIAKYVADLRSRHLL